MSDDLEERLLAAAGVTGAPEPEETPETPETTPETPAETPTETPSETPSEETQTSRALSEYIKTQFGEDFTGKYQDDHKLIEGLVNASRLIGRRDEEAQIGKFVRERPQEAYAWIAQQLGITPQQAQQVVEQPKSNVPEYDPEWARDLEFGEDGKATGEKPGRGSPGLAAKYNKAMDYAAQRHRELVFNPDKALEPLLLKAEERIVKKAREEWEQEWNQRQGQQVENASANQIFSQRTPWVFVGGDPKTGNYTPAGRVYNDAVQSWAQRRPDMTAQELDEIAMNAVKATFPSQVKAPSKTPVNSKVSRTTNTQTQTKSQEMQLREGETAQDFFTRIDKLYNMIPDED